MAHCGAKTRSGQRCRNRAMENGRCRMHGGKSTGAPISNKNAAKPGSIYSKFLTPEEQRTLTRIELGKVDDELRLTRIRLMRALARENEFGNRYEEDTERRELIEVDGRIVPGIEKVTTTRKVRDYSALIDKLTARIESLERTRAELAKTNPPEDMPVGRIEIEIVGGK
ncbi:HGGxSTG domain-containing protein [Advenella sp. FME57]|uniref:HGGxSTG domain-containing protein n=1 Tax=Advenella sp. FME57 TaxID=2742604 RepID=UPI002714CD61|nr:HGGxSTG domain-containing protein [Advenella sp. FME57]